MPSIQLTVKRYFDNQDRPTCSNSPTSNCMFLTIGRMGQQFKCHFDSRELDRYPNAAGEPNMGCLKPSANCMVTTSN